MDKVSLDDFERRKAALILSELSFQLEIPEGESYKNSIQIAAEDGERITGIISSDHFRILLAKDRFSGDTCQVSFGVDVVGLKAGDELHGAIVISSNLGEYKVQVDARITEKCLNLENASSSRENVRTLDAFSKLCMKNLREGFLMFTNPDFEYLLQGVHKGLRPLYKGMSTNPVTYQHLEEFLIAAGKKEPIALSLDREERAVYRLEASGKDTLYIYKSTWGYVRMEISVTGDFLQVAKQVVTTDDFIGKVYGLEYVIDKNKLTTDSKIGTITIKTVYQTLVFEIEASDNQGQIFVSQIKRQRAMATIMTEYLALCLKKMDYRSWVSHVGKLVDEMLAFDENDTTALLYKAYIAYSDERFLDAKKVLYTLYKGEKPDQYEAYALYLYLMEMTGLSAKDSEKTRVELEHCQKMEPGSYFIYALKKELQPVREITPSKELYELERLFECGSTSPFLYLAAWKLIDKQEELLRRLTPFMVQVLNFARKHRLMTEGVLKRVAFLSSGLHSFSVLIYRILQEGYETFHSLTVLEAICKLILRNDPCKREYHKWYEYAVKEELHLSRLYEYFLETADLDNCSKLPTAVRRYFAYNNTLSEGKSAFLYADIVRNKEQDPKSYEYFKNEIEAFADTALRKGRFDRDYAVLYKEFFERPKTREEARLLNKVHFMHRVTCRNKHMKRVIVCHDALKEEDAYPIKNGVAYIRLFTEDACILFEDEKRRRFASTIPFEKECLFFEKQIAIRCMELGVFDQGLELYLCKMNLRGEVSGYTLDCIRTAAENAAFTDAFRSTLRKKLLDYYTKHLEDSFIDPYVHAMDLHVYGAVDKGLAADLLIKRGLYMNLYQMLNEYGFEGVRREDLLKTASIASLNEDFREDESVLSLCLHVFKLGLHNELTLRYLSRYLFASLDLMVTVWEATKNFGLDGYAFEERILALSVFMKKVPPKAGDILLSYIQGKGKTEVICAFLHFMSIQFFQKEEKTEDLIFTCLERVYHGGWELSVNARLMLLKHYAESKTLQETQLLAVKELLHMCEEENLRFAFFQKLPPGLLEAYRLEDKVFVEEHFPSGRQVQIRYRILRDENTLHEWKQEPLHEIYTGIYGKEYLLFCGEVLEYQILIKDQENWIKKEIKTSCLTDAVTRGRTRYRLLNRMLAAKRLGNEEALRQAEISYLWQEQYTSELFGKLL